MKPVRGKHCAAFVPSSVSPKLWMPCTEPTIGSRWFCTAHRDAFHGAVLGLHAAEVLRWRSDGRRHGTFKKERIGKKEPKHPMSAASRSPRL